MYAAGRIPGSFFRHEGRPSDAITYEADRPLLRPSFVKGLRNEVRSLNDHGATPEHLYDVIAINAASLSVAGLPFSGPIGGVGSL
jgi:polyribonucleotide nucleotidyltransferase